MNNWHPNPSQAIPAPEGADRIQPASEFTVQAAYDYLKELPSLTVIDDIRFIVDLSDREWLEAFIQQRCSLPLFKCAWRSNNIPGKPGYKRVVTSGEAGKLTRILHDLIIGL